MKRMSYDDDKGNNVGLLDISSLNTKPYGEAIAYVIGGKYKTAVNGQPFYILYLKDCNGESITGFKFNVADYIKDGLSLTKIKNKFVKISYYDNCSEGFTRSLVIETLYLITNQSEIDADKFIGTTPGNLAMCDEILETLTGIFKKKVALSKITMMVRHYDYCGGKSGGVIYHHYLTLKHLLTYKDILEEAEFKELIHAFAVFLSLHLDYVTIGEDFDPSYVSSQLKFEKKMESTFNYQCKAEEFIYYFSGVVPRDYYVRTVTSAFETVKKTLAELHINRITPITQTGDAGYGTIKRYF